MGGNAIKNAIRLDANDYYELTRTILYKLEKYFNDSEIYLLPSYRNKKDFGDADILLEVTQNVSRLNNLDVHIKSIFPDTKEIVKNSHVYSFEQSNFQIDLILVPTKNFVTSKNYYSYSDLGNLQGRIAHKLGFKYGHDGLTYYFRDGTYQFDEILISKDINKIFQLLDYDVNRFRKGFDDLEDIFQFAASSKYFNKNIYEYDNRNHTARVRDRKRLAYRLFLEWIEKTEGLPTYPWQSFSEKGGRVDKSEFLNISYEIFPEFKEKYEDTKRRFIIHKETKEKFNGNIVSELTRLKNIELGNFMKFIKKDGNPDYETIIKPNLVKKFVMNKYEEYKVTL